jgi:hypothetical protein
VEAWPSLAKNPPEWRDATPDRIQPEEARGHTTCDRRPAPAAGRHSCRQCWLPARGLNPRTGDYWSAPFEAYRARTCRRLQEFARRSGTGVHDRHRLVVRRESRPRFAGVGCGVLSFLLPVTPEAAGSSPVDPRLHKSALDDPSRQSFPTTPPPTSLASLGLLRRRRRPRARRRVIAQSANNTDLLSLDRTPSRSNPRHRPPGPKRRSWRLASRTCIARASRRTGSGNGAQVSAATTQLRNSSPKTPRQPISSDQDQFLDSVTVRAS